MSPCSVLKLMLMSTGRGKLLNYEFTREESLLLWDFDSSSKKFWTPIPAPSRTLVLIV